jgi:DNA-binding transcriptional regulator YdaS (Cro superfamily)
MATQAKEIVNGDYGSLLREELAPANVDWKALEMVMADVPLQ